MSEKTRKMMDYYAGHGPHPSNPLRQVQKWQVEGFRAGVEAADSLADHLNGGGQKSAMYGLLYGLMKTHRHLQAQTVWTLLEALGRLPDVDLGDARNEHALKACGEVREALKERIYWEGL